MSFSRLFLPVGLVAGGVIAGVVLERAIQPAAPAAPDTVASTSASAPATVPDAANKSASGAPKKAKPVAAPTSAELNTALKESGPHRRRLLLAGMVGAMSVAELEKAIEALRSPDKNKIWTDPESAALLIGRLADLDPAHALTYAALRSPQGWPDYLVLRSVLDALAESRPDAVIAWLRGLPNDRFKRSVASAWLAIIAKSDPEGALAWAISEKMPAGELSGLFGKLAERDAMAAVNRASSMPVGEQRRAALSGAVSEWAKADPGAAMAWVRNRPVDRLRTELIAKAAAGYAESNPAAAAAYVMGSLEGRDRAEAARAVAESWMQADFAQAKGWIQTLPVEIAREIGPRLLGTWAEKDPAGAVDFVWRIQTGEGGRGDWAVRNVMSEWASRDFGAAKQWVTSLPAGPMRDAVLSGLVSERRWGGSGADIDPRGALDLIIQLGGATSDARRNLMSEQLQRWARDDFDAAALWARNQTDQKLANDLLGGALRELATYDPQRAIRALPTLSREAQTSAGRAIAESWAQSDPAAAARWVASWPPTDASRDAAAEIATRWVRQDARAAMAWLATQPADFLGQINPRVIGPLVASDVGAAQRLVERMPEGPARERAAEQFVRSWSRTDATAAQNWVTQTPILTPDQRQRLTPRGRGAWDRRHPCRQWCFHSMPAGCRRSQVQLPDDPLEAHVEALRACRRCPRMESIPVSGGAIRSRLLHVGQAPGDKEPKLGRPFAWTAGKTLFRWFHEGLGWTEAEYRARLYMAAVCRCFPGKKPGGGDRVPDPTEVQRCSAWLDREIELLQPLLVIPIGKLAIDQFLPPAKLDQRIGKSFRAERADVAFDVIPLPHPSGASPWHRMEPGKTLLRQALALIAAHPGTAGIPAGSE